MSLLDDPSNASCIVWTGRGTEFKLVEPEEVSMISTECVVTLAVVSYNMSCLSLIKKFFPIILL